MSTTTATLRRRGAPRTASARAREARGGAGAGRSGRRRRSRSTRQHPARRRGRRRGRRLTPPRAKQQRHAAARRQRDDRSSTPARSTCCWSCPVWKSTSASGARRAARNRHRHAIEQAPHRWRGGRRDDSECAVKFDFRTGRAGAAGRRARAGRAAQLGDAPPPRLHRADVAALRRRPRPRRGHRRPHRRGGGRPAPARPRAQKQISRRFPDFAVPADFERFLALVRRDGRA